MLTLLLLTGLITSFPLSSISPHSEAEIYRLLQKMQALEKGKHGWPLNDILTAEVSFLEHFLANTEASKYVIHENPDIIHEWTGDRTPTTHCSGYLHRNASLLEHKGYFNTNFTYRVTKVLGLSCNTVTSVS